jgi:hypothetical protein
MTHLVWVGISNDKGLGIADRVNNEQTDECNPHCNGIRVVTIGNRIVLRKENGRSYRHGERRAFRNRQRNRALLAVGRWLRPDKNAIRPDDSAAANCRLTAIAYVRIGIESNVSTSTAADGELLVGALVFSPFDSLRDLK